MNKRLDVKDRELLALLRANARLPVVALAKALGLSRSATQERLQRLESSGTIQGYTVLVRHEDTPAVLAWMRLKLKPGVACAEVTARVLAAHEVKLCHSLAGPTDMLVLVELSALDGLSDVRDRMAAITGVAEVETAPVLAVHLAMSR